MELILGLFLTLLVTPLLIWAANNYGLLDHPDERKQHQEAIPLVGGLAMAFAIAVSSAWELANADTFWGLFLAVAIIVVVGFLDDWIELSVGVRFLAQGIAALIMALFAGAQLISLGDLFGFGTVAMGVFAVPFTVFAVVGMANALNMSDGMDGLACGLALISATFVGAAAYLVGEEKTLITLRILGGALIGFLLTWAVIRVTQAEKNALPPAAALWFFAIPLWDTVSLMLRRMLKGKSPCHPGRDHLHHILLRLGYSDSQVVHFIHLVALACGVVGRSF